MCRITVECEDNIYCTCGATSKILRSDRDGGNVQVKEVKQVNGRGYTDVAVIGDEVIMCEANCNGIIVVFDKKLNYLRHFEQKRDGSFTGIASDSYGNVYTICCNNNCVQVFSNGGVPLHSFGCDENGVKKLSGPWDICVSGQNVYVVNHTSLVCQCSLLMVSMCLHLVSVVIRKVNLILHIICVLIKIVLYM